MKKKILISLLAALLLVCVFSAVALAAGDASAAEEFRVYKADLTLNADLRFNIKVQTGALPEGVEESDIKLLVWEGAADGADYTQADRNTAGYTELANPTVDENGLLVFTYSGVRADEMAKTLYLRAYYYDGTEDVYTEAKRYSMAQYLWSVYEDENTTKKQKAVIEALMAYGDAAQELENEGEPLPKISDGVVKITVAGGKFADGFAAGNFLMGEKLNVTAESTETAPTLTAELGDDLCWAKADGYYEYANTVDYAEGMFVDTISNHQNIFEVTVGGTSTIYKDKTLSEVFALADGGTVKLLKDTDMGATGVLLGFTNSGGDAHIDVILDLNGKKITSTHATMLDIYDAELTVKDSVGDGSVTTTAETVFYLNDASSALKIESGEFTGATFAVHIYDGTAEISGGTFTGNIFANTENGGTLSITGGTFIHDPSAYVASGYEAIENSDGTWTVLTYAAEVTIGGNTTKYTTLADAFANANGGTVKLLKDVVMGDSSINVVGVTITLDLNGKTITSEAMHLFDISNATLTVQDKVGGGGAKTTTTAQTVFYLNDIYSVLTIESGEFTSATFAVYVSYGTATITGGTFTSIYSEVVHVKNGKVEISGGEFTSESSGHTAVVVYISSGEVTISGGEFTGKNTVVQVDSGTVTISGGKFNGGGTVYVTGGELTITGGTFTGTTYAVCANGGTATISGGEFTSENVEVVYVYGGTLSITGGTFSEDPSAYVASGYEAIENSDGTWTVEKIGNHEYVPV